MALPAATYRARFLNNPRFPDPENPNVETELDRVEAAKSQWSSCIICTNGIGNDSLRVVLKVPTTRWSQNELRRKLMHDTRFAHLGMFIDF